MSTSRTESPSEVVDRVAIGVSLACVLHCLAAPIALALAPSLLPDFWDHEFVHVVALGLAVPLAAAAIGRGLRGSRDTAVLALAVGGLCSMIAGVLFHEHAGADLLFTVTGASAVAAAHMRNLLLRRRRSALTDAV